MADAERAGASDESDAGGSAEAASDGAEDADAGAEAVRVRTRPCPYCGASMRHRHCKYVCPAHGVVMDCSDTFVHR